MDSDVTTPVNIPAVHQVLITASDAVELDGVEQPLMNFAAQLAYLHFLLFGLPLVITSGKDGEHVASSFHGIGRALDFRTHDKSAEEMVIFDAILAFAAPQQNCRFFDERVGPGGEHLHLEYHGE
jgi:hypothetical protein